MAAPSLHSLAENLCKTLQSQLTLTQQLVELAKAQNEALQKNDIQTLQQGTERQQACLKELGALEQKRIELTCKLAKAVGMKGVPTLMQLLPHLSAPHQEALLALRKALWNVHEELASAHACNRLLLRIGLRYIQFSLQLLTAAALQPARYGTNLNEVATPSFYIDSKA